NQVGPTRAGTRKLPQHACGWNGPRSGRVRGNPQWLASRDAGRRRWRCRRKGARAEVERKGGDLIGMASAAELADQIAEGAVGEAELAGDVGQGTPLQKEGTQGLVTALLGLAGFAEELLAAQVVHDGPSQVSLLFRTDG